MALKPDGLVAGFRAPLAALVWLLKRPAQWPHAVVPLLVLIALEGVALAVGVWGVAPYVTGLLQEVGGALGKWGRAAAGGVSVIVAAALGWLLAVPLSPALSAPALERLVDSREHELGVPGRVPIGWLSEVFCGFRALTAGLLFGAPMLIVLWILGLILPVLLPITTALQILIGAWMMAWGLLDYPLTLRGVGVRHRLAFMARHPLAVLGFGASTAMLFWLPCCGILLLPAGVIGATELLWRILEQHPDDLVTLPRPPRQEPG